MSVKYIVVKQHNLKDPEHPRYLPQWKSRGEKDIHDISEELSHASTLSPADVVAMTEALVQIIGSTLAKGYIAKLGDFGSFHLALEGETEDSPEKVTANSIKASRVYFRPGKRLKKMTKNFRYTKK